MTTTTTMTMTKQLLSNQLSEMDYPLVEGQSSKKPAVVAQSLRNKKPAATDAGASTFRGGTALSPPRGVLSFS